MIKPNPLKDELRSAGASEQESAGLLEVASSLARLRGTEPVFGRPVVVRGVRRWPRAFLAMLGVGVSGLVVGSLVVALAQTSYPGNLLYPVKRWSEQAMVAVAPDYRAVVMMRRASEVKTLVVAGRSDQLVDAALQDYKTEMQAQKTKNYAALNYCLNNLVQAEGMASGGQKQQIAAVVELINRDKD